MVRRAAALGLFLAVLVGALVPCGEPPPPAAADAPPAAASVSGAGAWCGRPEPPQLLPVCPCGCEQRPHVAGVPVGVGLAVRAALPRLIPPPALTSEAPRAALRADAGVIATPDPVPLSV